MSAIGKSASARCRALAATREALAGVATALVPAAAMLIATAAFAADKQDEPNPMPGTAGVAGPQVAGPRTSAETGKSDERYQLAPGDRLSIQVFDQPEISGTYLVEPTNSITLPLLGAFSVTGMTPQVLQAQLASRLSDGFLKNPVVSVRLTDLRPVTIVGAVRSPGRYTYVDGMNVETALALAGGSMRVNSEFAAQRIDFLQADEHLKALRLQYLSQLARRARLEAQISGKPIQMPAVDPAERPVLEQFVAGEQALKDAENASQARQLDLLAERVKQITSDLKSFTEQADLEKQGLAVLNEQIGDYKGLLVNGLTKKSSMLDAERERGRARANLSNIMGNIARSRSLLAESELRRQEIETAFPNQKMSELQAVTLQVAQSESSLPIATEARALKLERLPFAATQSSGAPRVRILRYADGRINTFDAQAGTDIWPGDIVQIGSGLDGTGAPAPLASPAEPASTPIENPTAPANGPARLSQR